MDKSVLDRFVEKHGERAGRVISALSKQAKFKSAIETEVGQELFIDVLSSMEELLEKIINETAKDTELADFRALRRIANKWQDKLAAYNKSINQIANNKI